MIYGLIPVGGKGQRLGLPFPKEMLPQKNFNFYNPISNHIVEKMLLAKADRIVFVHGATFKEDIVDFFSGNSFVHITQEVEGFAQVLEEFINKIKLEIDEDKILFGLPDSIFNGNPFLEMLGYEGIVAGLFQTDINAKVDRINNETGKFDVKKSKSELNSDFFWGVLKFDAKNLRSFQDENLFSETKEIGEILNKSKYKLVYANKYIDLGTWDNYNRYVSDQSLWENTEIEKKYDANEIKVEDFINLMNQQKEFSYEHVISTDYYHKNLNENIEFVRYRSKAPGTSWPADITIKNRNKNQSNRFELVIPLSDDASINNVLQFLSLTQNEFLFQVEKECHIYKSSNGIIVFYEFEANKKNYKIIEIELSKSNFKFLLDIEELFSKEIEGFSPEKFINSSKFQIILGAKK